ncbi:cytochrome-c peroxidase [Aequorivita echinoideorum]|uniref:Cytochrome-c peroxidase n=1 Tax=Aequorivita echinoideorum TaxID=1549647 RepID=A0ABS5S169_9FLAO|nr:cytochrome c peroxidase [Aequorivita echinoideorum]MBT0606958.1 cytochrome-c peroxidase [Aequorivita echinoideorum]
MQERLRGNIYYFVLAFAFAICSSCSSEDPGGEVMEEGYVPTPKPLNVPAIFQQYLPQPNIPEDNPQTVEGVALGRKLFFDPMLSGDGTQSCATCHQPQNAFTDLQQFSEGIDGIVGFRNVMPIYNLAWNTNAKFFWDGRAGDLETQALEPVTNPIEMHNTWPNAVASLQSDAAYPELFEQAFGTETVTKELVAKAIAQFERTLISGNSPFDKYLLGEGTLTEQEINGFEIFMDEARGDCFHCHGNEFSPLWTDNIFHNNGLDEIITDKGLGNITGDPRDDGLFKSPSLRNLAYTAPYMHDGRFETLDEVINHYSEGLVYSPTIDPLMKAIAQGGVQLTESDKADLKAFLLSLSEPAFVNNPDFQNPN